MRGQHEEYVELSLQRICSKTHYAGMAPGGEGILSKRQVSIRIFIYIFLTASTLAPLLQVLRLFTIGCPRGPPVVVGAAERWRAIAEEDRSSWRALQSDSALLLKKTARRGGRC